jgi:hypothetical protein
MKNDIQAFPNRGDNSPGCEIYDGMTLRDYFAGQALASVKAPDILVGIPETERVLERHARRMYRMADAMLKERAQENHDEQP